MYIKSAINFQGWKVYISSPIVPDTYILKTQSITYSHSFYSGIAYILKDKQIKLKV
jgi:hypothetical protein